MSLSNVIGQSSKREEKEAIPVNAPESQGEEVVICTFVDSDHAGDKVSCRFRSSFLIYVNVH